MADMQISMSNIRKTRTLYIEDLDVAFTVRKLGAGEELDLSDKMRRLGAILKELRSIDFTEFDTTKKEDLKEIEKINERSERLAQEVAEIQRFELETYKACFSDDNDGKDVDRLLDTLSTEERIALFDKLFDKVEPVEAPEDVPNLEVEQEHTEEKKTPQNLSDKTKKELVALAKENKVPNYSTMNKPELIEALKA